MRFFLKLTLLIIGLIFHTQLLMASSKTPLIILTQGKLQGTEESQTWSYKGIPYARPPVGELRWKAPQEPTKWSGVFEADKFGSPCLQTENFDPEGKIIGQEDCLTLNIWHPNGLGLKRPVMVFFHGGSFSWGSSAGEYGKVKLYDGAQLSARGNVIVVTVNYRLGALGFLSHPDLNTEEGHDNMGLRDQIAALKWVKENIAQFGGDTSRVLIFGESAGAFSVGGLLVSPLANGLFSRALMQSGSIISDTREKAEKVAAKFAVAAECPAGDQGRCLRAMSPEQIIKSMAVLMKGEGERIVFGSYIDGSVIPDHPLKLFKANQFNKVPLLIGTNEDEMTTLIGAFLVNNPVVTEMEYKKFLQNEFGDELSSKIQDQYPLKKFHSPTDALKIILGDFVFHCPSQQIADAVSDAKLPVWKYIFHHTFHTDPLRVIGAGHALELPYVFHNFAPWYSPYAPDIFERKLSEEMIQYWSQFAATGNPNSHDVSVPWPVYDSQREKYLKLDIKSKPGSHYHEDACTFWQGVNPQQ